ncbi:MAG: tetratricopeptide repeat protein [Pseudomonadota bacterium]
MIRRAHILSLSALAALLGACAPEAPDAPPAPLRTLEAPVADAMSEDVAAYMAQRWEEFQTNLDAADGDTARAEAYADYGLASFGNGLVLPARVAFENAVALDLDDARWVYFLALLHQFTGDFDQATSALERVLDQRPGDVPTLLRLGDVRFEQARLDEASDAYKQVLASSPREAAAHYGLGQIASTRGDDRAAVRHFETVLAEQPGANRAHYLLGLAYRNLGENEKARASLAQHGMVEPSFEDPLFDAISGGESRIGGLYTSLTLGSEALIDGDYRRAAEQFRQATEDLPNDARAWVGLARALTRLGQGDDAADAYEQALAIEESADAHLALGKLQLASKRYEDAEPHFRHALALDPALADAHLGLADLLIATERPESAIEAYDAALALAPEDRQLLLTRAEALLPLGRSEQALAPIAAATQANPGDGVLRGAYGILLAQAGRADEAAAELNDALVQTSDDGGRARVWYAIGRLEQEAQKVPEAIEAFEQALSADPDHQPSRLGLARTQAGGRRYASAVTTYEAYLAYAPSDTQVRMEATMSAVLGGSGPDALRLLEAGAALQSPSPRVLSSLARLLVLTGDPAVRDVDRALGLAERSLRRSGAIGHAETLALALAAAGRAADAIELQEQVLGQAQGRASEAQLNRIQDNLARYRSGSLGRLPLDAG